MPIAPQSVPQISRQEQIESEVGAIVSLLLEGLRGEVEPVCVLWYGGFARGESGLYSDPSGRRLPFGDYDLEILCRKTPSSSLVRKLEASISQRFGYQSVKAPVESTLIEEARTFNVLDLKFSTPQQFYARPPDLATYDLLHSARILFGDDPRNGLQLELEQVPLFSAYRIMHKRLFHLLSLFHVDLYNPERELTHQEKVAFSLAICRLWLDFSMTLTLYLGIYTPDIKTRLKNLQSISEEQKEQISGFFRSWEGFLEGVRVAVEFKQRPRPAQLDSRAIRHGYFLALESWDKVMRVLQSKLLPYYFSRGVELEKIDYWNQSAEIYRKVLPKRYYRDYLKVMLEKRGKTISDKRLERLSLLANAYENIRFKGLSFLLTQGKRSFVSPEITFFSCVPLLAYSITPLGKIHFGMLNRVLNLMKPYRKCKVTLTGKENWQEVKDIFVQIFHEYHSKKESFRRLPKWLTRIPMYRDR